MRTRHLEWSVLVRWLESGEGADSALESHLLTCRRCARQADEARRLLSSLQDARLPSPPPAWIERALARIRHEVEAGAPAAIRGNGDRTTVPSADPAGLSAVLREIRAVLVGDSLRPSPALRGAEAGTSRVLVFETEEYSVALALEPAPPGVPSIIRGQIMPRHAGQLPSQRHVRAMLGGREVSAELSEFGEFVLEDAPASLEEFDLVLGASLIRMRIPTP